MIFELLIEHEMTDTLKQCKSRHLSEYLTERTGAKIGFDELVDFKKVETIADNLIELNQHEQCYQYLIQTCTSRDFFSWVERLQPARLDLY